MKRKYDWNDLYNKFIASEYEEVKVFIESLWRTYDWNCKKQTKGWSKQKAKLKEIITKEAIEKHIQKEVDNLEIPISQLKQAKKTVLWLVMRKLKQAIDWVDITVKEQEKILKMIKTELWEPTNISKTDATIKTNPLDESLFIQD